jgi:hypothetical protein
MLNLDFTLFLDLGCGLPFIYPLDTQSKFNIGMDWSIHAGQDWTSHYNFSILVNARQTGSALEKTGTRKIRPEDRTSCRTRMKNIS